MKIAAFFSLIKRISYFSKIVLILNIGNVIVYAVAEKYEVAVWAALATIAISVIAAGDVILTEQTKFIEEGITLMQRMMREIDEHRRAKGAVRRGQERSEEDERTI